MDRQPSIRTSPADRLTIHLTPVETLLAQTPLVALGEFRCPVGHAQFRGGGPQPCHYIVFPRNPVRIHVHGGDCEVATVGTLRLYNVGDCYDRTAVGGRSDECDWIAVSTGVLEDFLAFSPGSASAHSSRLFRAHSVPVSARLCLLQRRLFQSAARNPTLAILGLEEAVLACAARAIDEAANFWRNVKRPRPATRSNTQRRRREIAEQCKEILALDLGLDLSIADLAARVHCSVAHLARVFVAHTGRSLHEFRQQIRLHHAYELLASGADSLADVALQAGYASHSHMTEAFRRSFAVVPSRLRATECTDRYLREPEVDADARG